VGPDRRRPRNDIRAGRRTAPGEDHLKGVEMSSTTAGKGNPASNGADTATAVAEVKRRSGRAKATKPPEPPVPEGGSPAGGERAWGAIVVIAGLIAIVAVFIFAAFQYKQASEVTTAVGAVSGVIAALVGAYFGIRGATLAQQANSEQGGTSRAARRKL
jgi:hypothetical protein